MKKALFSALTQISSFFIYLSTPALAFAATPTPTPRPEKIQACPTALGFKELCEFGEKGFGNIVGTFITLAFVLAVLIALAFLVYGGIKWITSGGDKTAVEGARNTIVAAIVGLVIVFLSYFILNIILGIFNLSLTNLQLPKLAPK